MKVCPVNPEHGKFTNDGLAVHLARMHKDDLMLCPHPFCGKTLPANEMRRHWEEEHDTWRLHTGLFVWEAV